MHVRVKCDSLGVELDTCEREAFKHGVGLPGTVLQEIWERARQLDSQRALSVGMGQQPRSGSQLGAVGAVVCVGACGITGAGVGVLDGDGVGVGVAPATGSVPP